MWFLKLLKILVNKILLSPIRENIKCPKALPSRFRRVQVVKTSDPLSGSKKNSKRQRVRGLRVWGLGPGAVRVEGFGFHG